MKNEELSATNNPKLGSIITKLFILKIPLPKYIGQSVFFCVTGMSMFNQNTDIKCVLTHGLKINPALTCSRETYSEHHLAATVAFFARISGRDWSPFWQKDFQFVPELFRWTDVPTHRWQVSGI